MVYQNTWVDFQKAGAWSHKAGNKQLTFVISLGKSLVNIAVLLALSNSNETQFPMTVGVKLLLLHIVFEILH